MPRSVTVVAGVTTRNSVPLDGQRHRTEPSLSRIAFAAIGSKTAGPSMTAVPPELKSISTRPDTSLIAPRGSDPCRRLRPTLESAQTSSTAAFSTANGGVDDTDPGMPASIDRADERKEDVASQPTPATATVAANTMPAARAAQPAVSADVPPKVQRPSVSGIRSA